MSKRKSATQAHPIARVRTIELDGKSYSVEFNFRAYAAMKELTGISLINPWDPSKMDAREIACFIFSGLLTHQPDVEIDTLFDALRGENFGEAYNVSLEAYRASLPPMKEEANPSQPVA